MSQELREGVGMEAGQASARTYYVREFISLNIGPNMPLPCGLLVGVSGFWRKSS